VTPHRFLFAPDGQYQYSVHLQSLDRCAADCCQTYQVNAIPLKVLMPDIASGVIEGYLLAALRINRCLACCFAERT
jgi:hypothetical protein